MDWSVTSGTGLTMMPECRCWTKRHKTNGKITMPDWTFYRHPCISIVQIHAAWPKPCCVSMSMSILHVHVHVACPCQCCMSMSMSVYIYIKEMLECQTVRHPVSPVPDWKKLAMPEQVRYQTKLTQSGIFLVRYRTKIWDAGMQMPVLVSSMPMPSFGKYLLPSTLERRSHLCPGKADLQESLSCSCTIPPSSSI